MFMDADNKKSLIHFHIWHQQHLKEMTQEKADADVLIKVLSRH